MWWSSFLLSSPYTPAQVRDRLAADLRSLFPFFRGAVGDDGFRLIRRSRALERSTPVAVLGTFESMPEGGTNVRVRIRPAIHMLVILAAVIASLAAIFLYRADPADWVAPWFFAGCTVFLVVIFLGGGALEAYRCRNHLTRVLVPGHTSEGPPRPAELPSLRGS